MKIEMQIYIRKAEQKDIEKVFMLSNEDETRKYSINPNKITWSQHEIWFNKILNSDDAVLYIITEQEDDFIGQIRFDIEDRKGVVSISLIERVKGLGYGYTALKISHELVKKNYHLSDVIAYINSSNTASIKLFEKLGYILVCQENNLLQFAYKLEE